LPYYTLSMVKKYICHKDAKAQRKLKFKML